MTPSQSPQKRLEKLDLLGPAHAADGLHGRIAARAEGGIGDPDLEDEVSSQEPHGAGGAEWRQRDDEDFLYRDI